MLNEAEPVEKTGRLLNQPNGSVEVTGGKLREFATPVLLYNPAQIPDLLSVKQVAEKLGVCTRSVYGLVERNELPHARFMNTIRFDPIEVERFMEARGIKKRPKTAKTRRRPGV